MGTMLDVLVIIVVGIMAFIGFRKGIAQSVVSVIGTVVAAVMTMFLSNPVAEAIYSGGFKTTLVEKIGDAMKLYKQSGKGNLVENIMDTMPKFVINSLKSFGVTSSQLNSAANVSPEKVEELLHPIIVSFISVFSAIFLFIILLIIIKIISRFIVSAIDDSAISFGNQFLGAVLGIVEGFAIVIVAAFVIRITVPHLKEVPEIISDSSISESAVFKGIYDSSFLTDIVETNTKSPNVEKAG